MKMELTQRDKRLLIFLAIFVIVVCVGYWGIYPAVKAIKLIDEQIEVQQEQKEINEQKISMLPIVMKDNEELELQIEEARADFFPIMTSDEIDKFVTGIAITYGLHADSLDIVMPEDMAQLEPYEYSDKYKNPEAYAYEEEEALISIQTQADAIDEYATGEEGETEESSEEEEQVLTGIYDVHLKMNLSGYEANLQRLIDDLSAYDNKLQVAAYHWIENSDIYVNEEGNYAVNTSKALEIELDMYMCEN